MGRSSKIVIFANPAACGGLSNERVQMLKRMARLVGAGLLGLDTTSPDEFSSLVSSGVKAGDTAIFAGGDGTLHNGLNTLYGKNVTIGYIPLGTGNAAAYAFGLANSSLSILKRIDEQVLCNTILQGCRIRIDLVRVTTQSMNKSVLGLFASAGWCAQMASERKGRGLLGYVLPALKNVTGNYYNQHVAVIVDGNSTWTGKSTFIVVSKSPYYGAGVKIVPGALLDDGYLHSCVYHLSRSEITAMYATAFIGVEPKANASSRGKEIKLISAGPRFPVQVDGEYIGDTTMASLHVVEDAVEIITGPSAECATVC